MADYNQMTNPKYNLTIIGDPHCKVLEYKAMIEKYRKTIALGDLGFKREHLWHLNNIDNSNHKVLFGNHDDYGFVYDRHSLGDFGLLEGYNDIFFIRGAKSIDRWRRTEGFDWFSEEELNASQMSLCFDLYVENKPNVVLSHDCPDSVGNLLFGNYYSSDTGKFLDALFAENKPKMWIFGHYHKSVDIEIDGCRFICLKELESLTI